VFFLGGQAGSAERAAERYRREFPGLEIAALSALRFASPPSEEQVAQAVAAVTAHGSKIVLVGLGSPKQELLIQQLRRHLPGAWFVGVGGSFRFWAGEIQRAPQLVQGLGLEWLHRLAQEPRRLGKRYLVDNLPLFFLLIANATRARIEGAKSSRSSDG
jgi:N-acetylglucosaminyldiphosphoundecaprenol N-acetyl-beta-D-mannosaminyltransferase